MYVYFSLRVLNIFWVTILYKNHGQANNESMAQRLIITQRLQDSKDTMMLKRIEK